MKILIAAASFASDVSGVQRHAPTPDRGGCTRPRGDLLDGAQHFREAIPVIPIREALPPLGKEEHERI